MGNIEAWGDDSMVSLKKIFEEGAKKRQKTSNNSTN